MSAAKAKKPRPPAKGAASSPRWAYLVLVAIAAGLAWVVWPFFSPPPTPQVEAPRELKAISSHPDAEVLTPDGDDLKKK